MGLGGTEIIVILAVVLLFFGGKKLPALGNAMGKAVTNFKKGLNDHEDKSDS